jgi:Acetyltransferase (GNAT) domain
MAELHFDEIILGNGSAHNDSVMTVIEEALGGDRSLPAFLKNIDYESGNTRILGAFYDGELACINAFMMMQFTLADTKIHGYQSGFSATRNIFRGKGIWPKLMKFSEEYLLSKNGAFIFGFPNPISYPLFIKKLGYEEQNLHRTIIPNFPFRHFRNINYRFKALDGARHVLKPDLAYNYEWKIREAGINSIKIYNIGNTTAWGKIRTTRKLGISIRYFEIGGVNIETVEEFDSLLKMIFSDTGIYFCYISINDNSEYSTLLNYDKNNYSPIIIKRLGNSLSPDIKINFFSGMRDTY